LPAGGPRAVNLYDEKIFQSFSKPFENAHFYFRERLKKSKHKSEKRRKNVKSAQETGCENGYF